MHQLHREWLDLLLKIEPGTGAPGHTYEPDSQELRALRSAYLSGKSASLHRDELTRWCLHMRYQSEGLGLTANHIPAPAPAKASPPDNAWKKEAQEQARVIMERHAAKNLYPNLLNIADEIAKEWRKLGKFGPKGKPLAGGYIKRWALQGHGISNNRKTIISTSKGRGK